MSSKASLTVKTSLLFIKIEYGMWYTKLAKWIIILIFAQRPKSLILSKTDFGRPSEFYLEGNGTIYVPFPLGDKSSKMVLIKVHFCISNNKLFLQF